MTLRLLILVGAAAMLALTSIATAKHFGDWGAPVNAESILGTSQDLNTASNEGYPVMSPDGLSLYIVSDRLGGKGALDIWVATRLSTDDPWGAPENPGLPVNSIFNETSPAPVPGTGSSLSLVGGRTAAAWTTSTSRGLSMVPGKSHKT